MDQISNIRGNKELTKVETLARKQIYRQQSRAIRARSARARQHNSRRSGTPENTTNCDPNNPDRAESCGSKSGGVGENGGAGGAGNSSDTMTKEFFCMLELESSCLKKPGKTTREGRTASDQNPSHEEAQAKAGTATVAAGQPPAAPNVDERGQVSMKQATAKSPRRVLTPLQRQMDIAIWNAFQSSTGARIVWSRTRTHIAYFKKKHAHL